ncbi:hypothetical protein FOA43_000422 [Brettanomyces nanus]|uniref:Uncharacterized protein n=1 Tax=Eeniella nana TaxID=13502 RepID=A0A875RT34_EENNA|nr:uncharacterized protein FOA43_000422 [Brettanomyces nanus]QPG73117.1 hypothetical protein FOA43_000422 [Brettanomyces nanus]
MSIYLTNRNKMGKELIRENLVKPYVHTPLDKSTKASDFAASNFPMVAMFMRNKALSWSALFIAVQSYLNDPLIKDPSDQSQPAILKVVFAFVAVTTSYLDILFPQMNPAVNMQAINAAAAATATATATAATVTAATGSN